MERRPSRIYDFEFWGRLSGVCFLESDGLGIASELKVLLLVSLILPL